MVICVNCQPKQADDLGVTYCMLHDGRQDFQDLKSHPSGPEAEFEVDAIEKKLFAKRTDLLCRCQAEESSRADDEFGNSPPSILAQFPPGSRLRIGICPDHCDVIPVWKLLKSSDQGGYHVRGKQGIIVKQQNPLVTLPTRPLNPAIQCGSDTNVDRVLNQVHAWRACRGLYSFEGCRLRCVIYNDDMRHLAPGLLQALANARIGEVRHHNRADIFFGGRDHA